MHVFTPTSRFLPSLGYLCLCAITLASCQSKQVDTPAPVTPSLPAVTTPPRSKAPQIRVRTDPNVNMPSVYRRLSAAGFKPGSYPGGSAEEIKQAVTSFQQFAKMPAHGVIDTPTWERIQKLYDPQPAEKPAAKASRKQVVRAPEPVKPATPALPEAHWPESVIQLVQSTLRELGYQNISASGHMDTSTRQALRNYQQAKRVGGNGELTRKTLVAIFDDRCKRGCDLRVSIPAQQEGTRAPRQHYDLTGDAFEPLLILGMQQILTQLGYNTNGLDGRAGPRTHTAVRRFQRDVGLDEDGQATGQTAYAILVRGCSGGCELRFLVESRPDLKEPSDLKQPSDLKRS